MLHSWFLLRSSSDLIECRCHTFSEETSHPAVVDHCQHEHPDIAERSEEVIFFWFPIISVNTQCIQHRFLIRFKGIGEFWYFLFCLMELPRAVISEMASQVLLDHLKTLMYIWTMLGHYNLPITIMMVK